MQIVPLGAARAATLLWRMRTGAWAQTIVCKATFLLRHVECVLADEQDEPNEEDDYWDDDPSQSLCGISALAPFKVRCDVLLIGNASAPRGEPVRSVLTRLTVGEVSKSIEVLGDRFWTQDGELRDEAKLARMQLRYERAAGGPGTPNPVGIRPDGPRDQVGKRALPNLQPPGLFVTSPSEEIPPIGFGPIAPSWPQRRALLGVSAGGMLSPGWAERPLPAALDPRFFNAAPADQQVGELRPEEQIVLDVSVHGSD